MREAISREITNLLIIMSVRAYRVNKIEMEDTPTFNVWHHPEIVDFLNVASQFSEDGCGYIEVSVERLQELVDAIASGEIKPNEGETYNDVLAAIRKDIAWAKEENDDYVMYSCF